MNQRRVVMKTSPTHNNRCLMLFLIGLRILCRDQNHNVFLGWSSGFSKNASLFNALQLVFRKPEKDLRKSIFRCSSISTAKWNNPACLLRASNRLTDQTLSRFSGLSDKANARKDTGVCMWDETPMSPGIDLYGGIFFYRIFVKFYLW